MLLFCPSCSNILHVKESSIKDSYCFSCNTCPYTFQINQRFSSRTYPKLKQLDDVMGGAEAWQNVDSTEERCPECSHPKAYFKQVQTRSADEPMTTFYKCCNPKCNHQWRD